MTTEANVSEKKRIFLKDYQSPDFSIDQVELRFEIFDDRTLVHNSMQMRRLERAVNANSNVKGQTQQGLWLDGKKLKLLSLKIDHQDVAYTLHDQGLQIDRVPEQFLLTSTVEIYPHLNTDLEGLYKTKTNFLTQCEAQGFRSITYFLDRPDVMTHYQVTIEADKNKYPVLLSNGDLISTRDLQGGRQQKVWRDPFKKPCYLFALVAGQFGMIEKEFISMSGRKINTQVFCTPGMESRCQFALDSLIRSMKWDEERFGREYDLQTYMLVAADDFNAGAMENKGLNIFNSRLVYADPKTASDSDYYAIESVVGHEYFHNWTGNRVTLRDWFHLSLKEGLTVFRDHEFSMDLSSRSDVRISSVQDLRDSQFSEDAGPNAHPIRPTSCYAVDNFFTSTIYEKGAEIIRMMQTMVGRPGFRKGMDLYFERHDGQAVVIEDFARAIADANDQHWDQFKLWYEQAGTPQVRVQERFNKGEYELTLFQSCPPTPREIAENVDKKPFHIPLTLGLIDSMTGQEIDLSASSLEKNSENQFLIHLKEKTQSWTFSKLARRPILSLNRQFSAPIHLQWEASPADLIFLLKHDSDPFNRWEAGQKLFILELTRAVQGFEQGREYIFNQEIGTALSAAIQDAQLDNAMKARLLELPSSGYLAQLLRKFSSPAFEFAFNALRTSLAKALEVDLARIYTSFHGKRDREVSHPAFAERRLKNKALSLLSELDGYEAWLEKQLLSPAHMTDEQVAVSLAMESDQFRNKAMDQFFNRWQDESLTLNKWFSLIAQSWHQDTFTKVQELWKHPSFDKKNPNRNYSLLGAFGSNLERFHDPNHDTYTWYAERLLELDQINSAVAARLAGEFNFCTFLQGDQRSKAKKALDLMLSNKLSDMTFEVIKNCAEGTC